MSTTTDRAVLRKAREALAAASAFTSKKARDGHSSLIAEIDAALASPAQPVASPARCPWDEWKAARETSHGIKGPKG